MSRRERRKAAVAKGKTGNRWLARGAVIAFTGAVVLLGGGYVGLRSWLHGESFRHMLATEAGKAIRVNCEFTPLLIPPAPIRAWFPVMVQVFRVRFPVFSMPAP